MKKFLTGVCLVMALGTTTAHAAWTGRHQVKVIDSLVPTMKFVTLDGYVNPACDENRIIVRFADPQYYKEVFAMLLSAFLAGYSVEVLISETSGNCFAERVLVYR